MSSTDPQPALATTKRKFHRLLDGLDNLTASTSTTSLASTLQESNASTASLAEAATPGPPPKRSRLSDASMEQPRSLSTSSDRIRALQAKLFTPQKGVERSTIGTVRAVNSRKATTTASTTPRKAPNYQPYSQEQFLRRLQTFADVQKWTNKPDALSELEWAKRGWSCDTWNVVACKGGCEQRVVVKLRPKRKDDNGEEMEMSEDFAVDIDEGLVEKIGELIVDGHGEDCLWRKRGCSDDIYHIPIPNRAKSYAELLERYRSFEPIYKELPLVENMLYPDPRIPDVLKSMPSTVFNPPGSTTTQSIPASPSEMSAFAFALFGWSGVSDTRIAFVRCDHCFQRLGLWLYEESRLISMSQKLEVPVEHLHINILKGHREHCPWKNADAQRNPKDGPIKNMAAWQTLEFLIMGRRKDERVERVVGSATDLESYRGSLDSELAGSVNTGEVGGDAESLSDKWNKFKVRLRRTTSRKSIKSFRSGKSGKSGKSEKSEKSEKSGGSRDKENEHSTAH